MGSREIFILEDDPLVRQALKAVFAGREYQAVFFADGEALLASAWQTTPVCVLLDLLVPGKSGLDVLAALHDAGYPAPVFMMSGHGSIELAVKAARLGVAHFFEKPFRTEELIARIEQVVTARSEASSGVAQDHPGIIDSFTRRERQVWEEIRLGHSSKDIARNLGLSPRTVEDHRSNILKKAAVNTTAELLQATLADRLRSAKP